MAVTIATVGYDAGHGGYARVAYASDGTLWACLHSGTNNRWEFHYSTDDGANWQEGNTGLRIAQSDAGEVGAFTINQTDDFAAFAQEGTAYVIAGITTSSSAWTTVGTFSPGTSSQEDIYDIVAFRKPSSTNYFFAVCSDTGGATPAFKVGICEVTSAGVYVGEQAFAYILTDSPAGMSLDFKHTGDGQTVSGSPDLYVTYATDGGTKWFRATYSSGTWTKQPTRTLDVNGSMQAHSVFDGTYSLTIAIDDGTDVLLGPFQRDAADTTTDDLAVPNPPSDTDANNAIVAHDTSGNLYVIISQNVNDDIYYNRYDRTGASWDGWTQLEAEAVAIGTLAAPKAGFQGVLPIMWERTTSTAGQYLTENVSYNAAPNAPTWTSYASGVADADESLVLTWAFSDDDAGDAMSAYKLKRTVDGGSEEWWNGSTWTTETKMTTGTASVTVSSAWGADAEDHLYYVLTYDAADAVGPYSSALSIRASSQVNPTITAPVATITTSTPTITWTATEQTGYRLVLSGDQTGDTGWVTSTSKSVTSPWSLENGNNVTITVYTKNNDGLISDGSGTTQDVTFTAPVTPTLVVSNVDASGYISVAITNPAGGGGEPAVTENEVWVRVASGGRVDGERTVNDAGIRIATGVAEDATYYDHACGSGISYEYRVKGIAATGATAFSAWT